MIFLYLKCQKTSFLCSWLLCFTESKIYFIQEIKYDWDLEFNLFFIIINCELIGIAFNNSNIEISWKLDNCGCLSHIDILMMTSLYWTITWVLCKCNPLILHYFQIDTYIGWKTQKNHYYRKDNPEWEANQRELPTRKVTHRVWLYQSKTGLKHHFIILYWSG